MAGKSPFRMRVTAQAAISFYFLGLLLLVDPTDAGPVAPTAPAYPDDALLPEARYTVIPYPTGCPPGKEFLKHPDYCTKYFQCLNGVPVERDCPDGTVFIDKYHICVQAGSELDTCLPNNYYRECKRKTVELIPHLTRCQGYYNCSEYVNIPLNQTKKHWAFGYERECDFPQYFDIRLRKCVSYKNAICGKGREATKWYCNYYASQCTRCVKCYFLNPSCEEKEDGLYPSPYSYWSEYYFKCEDGWDWKGLIKCPDDELFDPDSRQCVHGNRFPYHEHEQESEKEHE